MGMAKQASSHPLMGPEPALGISAEVAREVSRADQIRNMSTGSTYVAKRQAKGFLKGPTAKKVAELLSLSRMRGLLTGHCYLKGHYKTGAGVVPSVTDANTPESLKRAF